MIAKRCFDLFFVLFGLLILSPIMLLVAVLIKFGSSGPILFKQVRVGLNGKHFYILKFRTMVVDAEQIGAKVTTADDPRITRVGHWLRKYKLDELPQLINVLKGEMSFVGPRPEVPEYVLFYPEDVKKLVLSVPPGITDMAAIEFRNENDLLKQSDNPVQVYREKVLPIKLKYYLKYVSERSLVLDFILILKTLKALLH